MRSNLFEYLDYKVYLNSLLSNSSAGFGRGAQAKIAEAIGCKTAFVAQVLKGDSDFSLEQCELINSFLGHTDAQSDYFLVLAMLARATHPQLIARLNSQLSKFRIQSQHKKNVRRSKQSLKLTPNELAQFVSSWHYLTLFTAIQIEKNQAALTLANLLDLELNVINEAISFFESCGLVSISNQKIIPLVKPTDLPLEPMHTLALDIEFRLKNMTELHSGDLTSESACRLVTLSIKDYETIKNKYNSLKAELAKLAKTSNPEMICYFEADLKMIAGPNQWARPFAK